MAGREPRLLVEPATPSRSASPDPLGILIVAVLAYALRVYRLSYQSLWYDEGFSGYLASLPLPNILEYRGMDPHPPLYAAVLHLWTSLAGGNEIALRFPSVMAGVVAVALCYRLAADLYSPRAGVYAALLAATNPFLIYYAQETRPYSFLLVLSLGSTVVFQRILRVEHASNRRWLVYIVVTALALWSHYFAAFTLAGHWLLWAMVWPWRRRPIWPWLGAQGLVLLAIAPWLATSIDVVSTYRVVVDSVAPVEMVRRMLLAFVAGPVAPIARPFATLVATLGILGVGVVGALLHRRKGDRALAVLFLVVSAAAPLVGLVMLSPFRPTFSPRYLIAALPSLLVLAALTPALAASVLRPAGWAALTGMTLLTAGWTAAYYHDPGLARDDYRSAAAFLESKIAPDDAVLFHAWYTQFPFALYFHGQQERSDVFRTFPVPEEAVVAELNRLNAGHPNLWLVMWQDETLDPGRYAIAQLEQRARWIDERWFGSLRVIGYKLPGAASPFVAEGIQTPMHARLGEAIELHGFRLNTDELAAGESLRVALYWQVRQPVAQSYTGFVHLLSLRGAPLVHGQQDHAAGGDYHQTSDWRAGELVRDEYVFLVPPDTPPGEDYILEAGMYTPDDVVRLRADGEGASPGHDSLFLSQRIRVQPRR